jgi:hypothetical protein
VGTPCPGEIPPAAKVSQKRPAAKNCFAAGLCLLGHMGSATEVDALVRLCDTSVETL